MVGIEHLIKKEQLPESSAQPAVVDTDPATDLMGQPAAPGSHPNPHHPYLVYSPVHNRNDNPFESLVHMLNSWSHKADTIARNVWHNLKTGPSVSETAWGKLNLMAKALTEGGFESLFKQIFPTDPNEKLMKTFTCYLSTSAGPVAGTLYLSTAKVAFCSDRPLSFRAPSEQQTWWWSYYKVMIPLTNFANVNPVVMRENPPEKYIQIATIDAHEFWFMGFVNFEKASHNLLESVSDFRAHRNNSTQQLATTS